jgi:penicillin amidase
MLLIQLMGILLVLALGLAAAVWLFYRHPLPRVNGRWRIQGLLEPVTIERDRHGYVRIQATSVRDAIFAQGFVHAQDRLWQMELNRRIGSGRLAEVFGQLAVPADIFTRRLGLRRAAQSDLENLQPREAELLEAYAAGVNAARAAMGWRLPLEFRLLGFAPEAWTVLDSLTWIQVMSMDLCANWEQELLRAKLLAKAGPVGARLLTLFTRDGRTTVPSTQAAETLLDQLSELYEEARQFLPNCGVAGGSNAWVVSGQRSVSGKPLLASDPHLMGRVPSVWHEVHLRAPGLDVQGVSFPGLPLVVIGHNQKVAWGVTNSFADTQDLYIERFHPEDPNLVETEHGYLPVTTLQEVIQVKDGEPVTEQVQLTRHGPILVRCELGALALKWVNYEPSHPVATLLAMNQARSAAQFKEALRSWQAPSNSFVYADSEGNIGYLMAGQIPIRKKGSGLTPVPGWDGEWEWLGMIPFEQLPGVENPECGYLVTANNPVVDSSFPYHITWDWQGSSRASRIENLLRAQERYSADDFQRIQMDFHSELGLRFVELLGDLEPPGKSEARVLEILRAWDGDGGPDSAGMAVYQVLLLTTLQEMLEPVLGQQLFNEFLGTPANPLAVMASHSGRYTSWLINVLEEPESFMVLEHEKTLNQALQAGLTQAARFLEDRLGPQPERWKWGKLHRLVFQHALGVHRVLGGLLNSPVVPMGGDTDTVCQTAVIPHQSFAPAWCPSWRQVVDLARPQQGRTVLATGQSGHPASPNYMDQFPLWCAGQLREHPQQYRHTLTLHP